MLYLRNALRDEIQKCFSIPSQIPRQTVTIASPSYLASALTNPPSPVVPTQTFSNNPQPHTPRRHTYVSSQPPSSPRLTRLVIRTKCRHAHMPCCSETSLYS
ncbi:hypothetical protein COCSADRAFT_41000 [Bipolaris sorokiniana ND90Pr]|uniref:Uncharacterized protein n=1 Tax=Cochliobolus sativus (strain ND90Pr / ATCC 201652) TaxID=665912 RepID=M2RXQ7_COCSN|nr:uncharacterized protein COCSADRAFT_41000 [Bipolaris sorokiniana ND90Pr]EMD59848.1 hypothetical protein COCSADRAFT_41000 [Bipolaris sorokiniana ND90Pr]